MGGGRAILSAFVSVFLVRLYSIQIVSETSSAKLLAGM
jgi:hypothetical protein